jgi:phosphate transport system protein
MMKFQEEMTELRRCTMNMASLTASMVERSIDVLLDLDLEGAERMVDDFTKVDRLDRKIEESAIRILTLYQPMASDMRAVATYMKSITYMERIAKYCKNIAVAAQYLKDKPTYDVCECLRPMGDTAAEMVRIVIDGLMNASVDGFDRITDMDNILDDALRHNMKKIIDFITTCPESADMCTYYISVMKFIERIGDHACKIAEKVTFMVTGFHAIIE